jgi:hypothetical protein
VWARPHPKAATVQHAGEALGLLEAVRGALAASDDRDGVSVGVVVAPAADIKDGGRVGNLGQQRRIVLVADGDEADVVAGGQLELHIDGGLALAERDRNRSGAGAADAGDLFEL